VRDSGFEVRSLAHPYNIGHSGVKVKKIFVKRMSTNDKSAFILGYRGDFDRLADDPLTIDNVGQQ
tara:strand:+ start:1265 stop:1459 length:195 start_codon:yes stop_codon:yes gene_type:complete